MVVVSSSTHGFGKIVLDDLNFEKRRYGAWASYGQAKLANLLMASELARRLKEEGSAVEAFSLHPGLPACRLSWPLLPLSWSCSAALLPHVRCLVSVPSLFSLGVIKTNLGAHMGWRASAFYWLFGEDARVAAPTCAAAGWHGMLLCELAPTPALLPAPAGPFLKTPSQGASTTVYAATAGARLLPLLLLLLLPLLPRSLVQLHALESVSCCLHATQPPLPPCLAPPLQAS